MSTATLKRFSELYYRYAIFHCRFIRMILIVFIQPIFSAPWRNCSSTEGVNADLRENAFSILNYSVRMLRTVCVEIRADINFENK